jgi:hypothetical protein
MTALFGASETRRRPVNPREAFGADPPSHRPGAFDARAIGQIV